MADDRYDRVWFHGKLVDKYTRQALEACEKELGYELTIVQGSYHGGVSASAGTHDGGGTIDLAPYDWARKVKVLRKHGFAAWYRPAIPGLWGPHIHAVQIGNSQASPSAKRQTTDYRNKRNGLANHAYDGFWRPRIIRAFKYKSGKASTKPEGDDDMPGWKKKLHRVHKKLRPGKWEYVTLNSKGDVTLLFGSEAHVFGGRICLRLNGLHPDDTVKIQLVRSTKKGKVTTKVQSLGTDERRGSTGSTYIVMAAAGTLASTSNSRLRLRVKVPKDGVSVEYVWPQLLLWK